MIYLDNAATTKPSQRVLDAFIKMQTDMWGNPSALHSFGEEVFFELKRTRDMIKDKLHAVKGEIYFTSCATEAINLFFQKYLKQGMHAVVSQYEHAAVYENIRAFELAGGEVTYIKPVDGIIRPEDVANAVKDNTAIVAVMQVNNEIGAVNDIIEISRRARERKKDVKIFVDGVQALGKVKVDIDKMNINGYTISAHKFYGLKGNGLLYLNDVKLNPLIMGGGQEMGMRSGTENTGGIIAMGVALADAVDELEKNCRHISELRKKFIDGLSELDGVHINSPSCAVPNILNMSFEKIKGEVLVHMLEAEGIYVNTSSACSKNGHKKSRTLSAIGLRDDLFNGAIRFSFARYNTVDDIEKASAAVCKNVRLLRRML